jgi:glutamine amidotransferase
MITVALVDYGAGNLGNAERALGHLGFAVRLVRSPGDLKDDVILLPGVGAWGAAMRTLTERGLVAALRAATREGQPMVGICLGLQLLFERSDETPGVEGLGILKGRVRRLQAEGRVLPHLGWALVSGTPYYFAHAYRVAPDDQSVVVATAEWGEVFPAVVVQGGVRGAQFHPERSGEPGMSWLHDALSDGP